MNGLIIGQLRKYDVVNAISECLELNEDTKGTLEKIEVVSFDAETFMLKVYESVEKNNYLTVELGKDGQVRFNGMRWFYEEPLHEQIYGIADYFYDDCIYSVYGSAEDHVDDKVYLETVEIEGENRKDVYANTTLMKEESVLYIEAYSVILEIHNCNANYFNMTPMEIYKDNREIFVAMVKKGGIQVVKMM